ncbi:hypothetical protein AU15_12205 [Marinobacter salarius]|uniref:Uncharacterized protein n=1 Tax=Marinobacter salarius TaxID=1420917 RepID=W5YVQ6_9GAMM|nr:hypothetical protein AU15_12205 [Marinobacter salarius]
MCHSRPASLLIVLSFLLSISACGGGGGGGGSDGSASYTIGGTVTGAVNSGLALENNGGDTLEVGGVDFEFATKLADGSSYDVTLATLPEHQLCSMENASGTVVGADVNDVSVLCRSWRSAALIETGTGEAASPQIAFNNDGNAIAVWVQFDGTQDNIWASIYSPGGGWSAAVVIGDENGDARAPQIAIDDDGNAIVVWTQQSTYYNAWIRRYSPDSGWSSEGLIEFNGGDASDPQIAMNNAGNAIIVWVQNEAPPTSPNPLNLWANTYTPGVGSGTAELVEADAGSAQDPQVAFDSAGNAIAVWEQYNGSTWYDIRQASGRRAAAGPCRKTLKPSMTETHLTRRSLLTATTTRPSYGPAVMAPGSIYGPITGRRPPAGARKNSSKPTTQETRSIRKLRSTAWAM